MKAFHAAAVAVTLALGAAACSSDEPTTAVESSAPSSSTSTPTSERSAECQVAVDDFLALYDALAEATTLEDPTKATARKVVDDSAEMRDEVRRECSSRLAAAVSLAHDQMVGVDATITACDMTDPMLCGTRVDDSLDVTWAAVEDVRAYEGY